MGNILLRLLQRLGKKDIAPLTAEETSALLGDELAPEARRLLLARALADPQSYDVLDSALDTLRKHELLDNFVYYFNPEDASRNLIQAWKDDTPLSVYEHARNSGYSFDDTFGADVVACGVDPGYVLGLSEEIYETIQVLSEDELDALSMYLKKLAKESETYRRSDANIYGEYIHDEEAFTVCYTIDETMCLINVISIERKPQHTP